MDESEVLQHTELVSLALQRRVLTYVEVHKRWDPMYMACSGPHWFLVTF